MDTKAFEKALKVAACLALLALCGGSPAWAQPASAALGASQADSAMARLAGHYYLQGVREAGSELILSESGRFQLSMTYGAVDRFASGTWSMEKGKVALRAALPPGSPKFRAFSEDETQIRKPAAPGRWVAVVGVPGVGPAPGVKVVFRAASGATAEAVSDGNGDADVSMPAHEKWVRVGLGLASRPGQIQWIDLPPARSAARIAGFAIDDLAWVQPLPFEALYLVPSAGGLASEDGSRRYQR